MKTQRGTITRSSLLIVAMLFISGMLRAQCTVPVDLGPDQVICDNSFPSVTLDAGPNPGGTYLWSDGSTAQTIVVFAPGTYWVTVTDNTGCQDSDTIDVFYSPAMTATASVVSNATCGQCNGAATVSVAGGTPPYTYAWHNGAVTPSISLLCPGQYNPLVTDSYGCLATDAVSIGNTGGFNLTAIITDENCAFGGSIDLSVAGGTPPYVYEWWNGSLTQDQSGLMAGFATVTVTDNAGCIVDSTFYVGAGTPTIINVYNVTPTACTVNNGIVLITSSGGTPPYQYSLDGSTWVSSNSFNGLNQYDYGIFTRDATGCMAYDTVTIGTQNTLQVTPNVTNASCPTCADGEVVLTCSGLPPYTFAFSTGATTAQITGLLPGNYGYTVTDNSGCSVTGSVAVPGGPCTLTATINATPILCSGNNSNLSVTASGGGAISTYLWNVGATTSTMQVPPGSFGVTITDVNGCTATDTIIVTQPLLLAVATSGTNTTCGTCNDGTATAVATGGTPPYTYMWLNTGILTATATNLPPGVYTVNVTDNNGCSAADTVLIDTTSGGCPVGTIQPNPSSVAATCLGMDGSATVAPTGGQAPYTYLWSNGMATATINVPAGVHNITVTDATGCFAMASVPVFGPFQVVTTTINVSCNGASTGAIGISASGGTAPYEYSVDGFTWQAGNIFTGLVAGGYYGFVKDATGCVSSAVATITQPDVLNFIFSSTDATCAGCSDGTATVTASGGPPSYTYLWNTGGTAASYSNLSVGTYTVTVTDANNCTAMVTIPIGSGGTPCTFTADLGPDVTLCGSTVLSAVLSGGQAPYSFLWSDGSAASTTLVTFAGTYSVTVTDANGCTGTDEILVNAGVPAAAVDEEIVYACAGAGAQLGASGGTSYNWSPTTNLSNPNIANPIAFPLNSTTYTVTISDGAGCSISLHVYVVIDNNCVWPGDADADGVANTNDVLAIGVGYGFTGPVRDNATLVWQEQPASSWNQFLANGSDLKHTDTDGDGVINDDDTLAISLNYNLTHLKQEPKGGPNDPALYFVFPDDSVAAGQTIQVPIYLGTSALPVDTVYGIRFSVTYDNTLVDTNTVDLNISTSWLGNTGEVLSFRKDLYSSSRTAIAMTRNNHTNVSGYGQIGVITYTMKDDISGKDVIYAPLTLGFEDVKMITATEHAKLVNSDNTLELIVSGTVGIGEYANAMQVQVYPNPANNTLYVKTDKVQVTEMKVLNLLGQVEMTTGNTTKVDISHLSAGSYFLQVTGEQGETAVVRFSIAK